MLATADVVVILGEWAGVEDAFRGLPLAAERSVLDDIDDRQAHGVLGQIAAEGNVEDDRLYMRMS